MRGKRKANQIQLVNVNLLSAIPDNLIFFSPLRSPSFKLVKVAWEGTMVKKPGTVMPITAAERRVLDGKIKKRHERLRRRYKEIRGKRVDWISHNYEDGLLYVGIRFTDGTYFSLQFSTQIVTVWSSLT